MTVTAGEKNSAGQLRDAAGRKVYVVKDENAPPASTDIPTALGVVDRDGREHIVISGLTTTQTFTANLRSYGAVGDGVTSDRAAWVAAIAALVAVGGGELFVPAGTYLLPLDEVNPSPAYAAQIPSNVHVVGEPGRTVLQFAPNAIAGYRNFLVFTGQFSSIRGCIIDGGQTTRSQNEDCMGVSFANGATDIDIIGNEFRHIKGDAINHGETVNATIARIRVLANAFHDCTGQAILFGGGSGVPCTDLIIDGNTIRDTLNGLVSPPTVAFAEAISLYPGVSNAVVTNNTVRNWGPVYLETTGGVVVEDNQIVPPYSSEGVVTGGAGGNYVFAHNLIDNSISINDKCFSFDGGPDNVLIEGNRLLRGAGDAGGRPGAIVFSATGAANNLVIRGNVITGGVDNASSQADIVLGANAGSTGAIVEGNSTNGATTSVSCSHDNAVIANNNFAGHIIVTGDNCLVDGNRVFGAGQRAGFGGTGSAIFALDADNLLVQGNMLDADGIGVDLRGPLTTNALVTSNRIKLSTNVGTYGVLETTAGGLPSNTRATNNKILNAGTAASLTGAGSSYTAL